MSRSPRAIEEIETILIDCEEANKAMMHEHRSFLSNLNARALATIEAGDRQT